MDLWNTGRKSLQNLTLQIVFLSIPHITRFKSRPRWNFVWGWHVSCQIQTLSKKRGSPSVYTLRDMFFGSFKQKSNPGQTFHKSCQHCCLPNFIPSDSKELSEEEAETASSALSMASRRSCRSFRGASLGLAGYEAIFPYFFGLIWKNHQKAIFFGSPFSP